ncbi:putative Polyketide biosynthesis acyl-carrier-protein AcpK [Streptomyces aurantiacus JA 4570]|uniref:Putative Polyketide biosynthesis acyl-carrier-protein AcpK n=2 Tax=Streptomyces aurantiacus TaxID=47760 RepID=S3ZKY4_9ACTN|nr:putative Polyketide biosynthesis acyl-carrier-protein AcpK [Streptomyces aurantiacus JA 4570]
MTKDQTFTLITEAVREILPELADRDLHESDTLDALGANSMDRAEIVMTVLEEMDLDIPLVETHGPQNLGELARHLSDTAAVKAR